jgi:hypothetical protein
VAKKETNNHQGWCWESAAPHATGPPREGQRINGLLQPFLPYPKKVRPAYDRQDDMDGRQLRLFSSCGVVLATIEPDLTWPGMWRVRLPDGHLTDVVNRSRAKDGASSLALGVLNREREAA